MDQMQDSDYKEILSVLENKIPQEKVRDIITKIKKASDLQDHWDSPYTRPTFAKILLLTVLIVSVLVWLLVPLYWLFFSSEWVSKKKAEILIERQAPSNNSFAFNILIEKTLDWNQTISMYNKSNTELLAKSDLKDNQAFVISSKIGNNEIKTNEIQMLKTTRADLNEDIKEDVLWLINNNIIASDEYMDFKSINYGVDTIISDPNQPK